MTERRKKNTPLMGVFFVAWKRNRIKWGQAPLIHRGLQASFGVGYLMGWNLVRFD